MKFSILVPVYNAEKYLDECIKSIINQSYDNYEIILVNDGSLDRSGDICNNYKSKYPNKIQVIHQENKGQFLTRRLAISKASGEYVIFLDSDDYIRYDSLEIFNKTIEEYNIDMIIFKYIRVNDTGKIYKSELLLEDKKIFEENSKKELYKKILLGSSLNNLCNKVIKRELLNEDGNFSNLRYVKNGEDLLQLLPCITNAPKIIYLNEELYYYRLNPNSVTKSFNENYYNSIKYVATIIEEYLERWEMRDDENLNLLYKRNLDSILSAIEQIGKPYCKWSLKDKKLFLLKILNDEFYLKSRKVLKKENISLKIKFVFSLLNRKQFLLILILNQLYEKAYYFYCKIK